MCSSILTGIMRSASMHSASIVLSTCWVSALEHGAKTLVGHGIRFHESMTCFNLLYIFLLLNTEFELVSTERVD